MTSLASVSATCPSIASPSTNWPRRWTCRRCRSACSALPRPGRGTRRSRGHAGRPAARRHRRTRGAARPRTRHPVRAVRAYAARGHALPDQPAARPVPLVASRPRSGVHGDPPRLRVGSAGPPPRRPAAGRGAFAVGARARPGRGEAVHPRAQVNAGVVFGEGAGACLVRAGGERDRLLSYATAVNTDLDLDQPDVAVRAEQEYPDWLAKVITTAVRQAGVRLDDITAGPAAQRQCGVLATGLSPPRNPGRAGAAGQRRAGRARVLRRRVPELPHRGGPGPAAPGRALPDRRRRAARGATFSAMVLQH